MIINIHINIVMNQLDMDIPTHETRGTGDANPQETWGFFSQVGESKIWMNYPLVMPNSLPWYSSPNSMVVLMLGKSSINGASIPWLC